MAVWRRRRDRPAPQWSQQKMQALVLGGIATTAALILGLGYAAYDATLGGTQDAAPPTVSSARTEPPAADRGPEHTATPLAAAADSGTNTQDTLADRAMPAVDDTAAHPGPVSTADPGSPIVLPPPAKTGAAAVPSGYPQTPQGALAQLAAIDVTAVQSGSLTGARRVLAGWATPGGPTATSWTVLGALSALFDSAGLSGGGSPQLALVLTPLMGQLKGSDGPAFTVPCVDYELDVTLSQTARGAVADCQRMVWIGGRWMIGAGSEPAAAPAVWADTDTALAVGYRDLSHG